MSKSINNKIREFERKHGVKCVTQEAGFGEVVTGFIKGWMYVSVDKNLVDTKTKNAYSHCNIFAVNINEKDDAKGELCEWIDNLEDKDIIIKGYHNDYTGVQAQECGSITYVLTTK